MDSNSFDERKDEREHMVGHHIVHRGVKDEKVLDAFRKVPRHAFVSEERRHEAYEDHPLPIGLGQTISQPYMVASMIELLALKGDEKILEIGTGSGYQTAILSELVCVVYSIEYHDALAKETKKRLDRLGYSNIHIKCADGGYGWKEAAPFDGVIISAATPQVPNPLKEQLRDGGVLICPEGSGHAQTLMRYYRRGKSWEEKSFFQCVFVPLVGEYGI